MRIRGLLVAVVLLAGLGVGLYFSNKEKAAEAAKPPANDASQDSRATEADIYKGSYKEEGRATETDLEKGQRKMADHRAEAVPADQDAVNQLVCLGRQCQRRRVVEDKASQSIRVWLESPTLEVDITGKGGKVSRARDSATTRPPTADRTPAAAAIRGYSLWRVT